MDASTQEYINRILAKIESLEQRHENVKTEILALKQLVNKIRETGKIPALSQNAQANVQKSVATAKTTVAKNKKVKRNKTAVAFNFEKFIGENLINKIGIAILVIGIGIGIKYAIDHNKLNAITRISIGYISGAILLFFAFKLRNKFKNYSAVLLGGSMAVMYVVTFMGYSLYDGLIPKPLAYILMLVFTLFTVLSSLQYKMQTIAHFGLVGAYAVPFLLSSDSGNANLLFSYISVINIGILFLCIKKYWKPLYYSSFGLTWIIYLYWFSNEYTSNEHLATGAIFLSLFYAIFYSIFITYKLLNKKKFGIDDILILMANSALFYGIGMSILNQHPEGEKLLGLFTAANAILHFIVALIIYRSKLADKTMYYFVFGLVLIFLTITAPIQLDGNWVTLIWAGEAAVLYWLGKSRKILIYEILSYAAMVLAFGSIIQDYGRNYFEYYPDAPETFIRPIFNVLFLSSIIFTGCFSFIVWIKNKYQTEQKTKNVDLQILQFFIPAILILVAYLSIFLEIGNHFHQYYETNTVPSEFGYNMHNSNIKTFKNLWLINYTFVFASILLLLNKWIWKNNVLKYVGLGIGAFSKQLVLFIGLYAISELREDYLNQNSETLFHYGEIYLYFRYIVIAFMALMLVVDYLVIKDIKSKALSIIYELVVHLSILWISCSELLHWLSIYHTDYTYKLGLSLMFGSYGILLIILGIWKKRKYLRFGGIVLFGITLLKLFFYDISNLSSLQKTIAFVALGIFMLSASFLYNKFKHIIFDSEEDKKTDN